MEQRVRASSSEWQQYYERAERARCRWGDPFERILRRRRALGRIGRCATCCFLVAAFFALVMGALWLSDNVSWQSIADTQTETPG